MARQSKCKTTSVDHFDQDFIGKLPDCLLHHIVSLLPYKEAARTAALAARWRRLLPSSRVVDFDERKLGFLVRGESDFVGFAKKVMEQYKETCVDKFLLTLNVSSPEDFLDKVRDFVSFAAEKKAKVMLLDFSRDGNVNGRAKFDLPMKVYENTSLETLKLYSCEFDPLGFKNFALILHISLGYIELAADSLQILVEKCASLKSLRLKKCLNTDVFVIKGPVLESLVIEDCDVDLDCWIDVQAPKLKFLKYSGNFCNFEFYVTERLEEAVLDFGTESEFQFGCLLFDLFRYHLNAVKVLTICSYVLQTIPSGDEPLGIRSCLKVKHLILKTAMHENEFYGIRFFLNSCPSLETLTIEVDPTRRIFEDYESPFEEKWDRALPIYVCLIRTLKTVNVKGYRGNNNEFCLLAYFVFAGRAMEKLNVEFCEDTEMITQKARMLQIVKKASPNLQISISAAN